MSRRLNVFVTVLTDGRGKLDSLRLTLEKKGLRGWTKSQQTQLSNLLLRYATTLKGKP